MSNVMIYCSISVGVGCKTEDEYDSGYTHEQWAALSAEEKQRVIDANYDNHCHSHLNGSAYAKDAPND